MNKLKQRGPVAMFLGILLLLLVIGGVAYGSYQVGLGDARSLSDGSFDFDGEDSGSGYRSHWGVRRGFGFFGIFPFIFMFFFFGMIFKLIFGFGWRRRMYGHDGPHKYWRGRYFGDEDMESDGDDASDNEPDPKPKKESKPSKKSKKE